MSRRMFVTAAIPLCLAWFLTARGSSGFAALGPLQLGTGWQAQVGGFATLGNVVARSETDIWAAGGHLAHFDGKSWTGFDWSVDGLGVATLDFAEDVGWAVTYEEGGGGKFLRWGGTSWVPTQTVTPTLRAVSLADNATGWAVGHLRSGSSFIYELAPDATWHLAADFPTVELNDVAAVSPGEAWAVGDDGVIVHHDMGRWERLTSPINEDLRGLAVTAADDIWAVGGIDNEGPPRGGGASDTQVILHYDGHAWTVARHQSGPALMAVAATSTSGWAVGDDGLLLSRAGGSWTVRDSVNPGICLDSHLYDVANIPGTERYVAVGAGLDCDPILWLSEDGWSVAHSSRQLAALAMPDSSDGWAVGGLAPPLHFNGSRWSAVTEPPITSQLVDVAVGPDGATWGITEQGALLRTHAGSWNVMNPDVSDHALTHIRFGPKGDGWILAYQPPVVEGSAILAEVLRLDTAVAKVDLAYSEYQPGFEGFTDIDSTSPNDVWVVGSGRVVHFDGQRWVRESVDGTLFTIDMRSSVDGWAGGSDGLSHFDGITWTPVMGPDDFPGSVLPIEDIQVTEDGSAWASAGQGTVLYFDGKTWRFFVASSRPLTGGHVPWVLWRLQVFASAGSTSLWAVGDPNTILHWEGRLNALPTFTPTPSPTPYRPPFATPVVPPKVDPSEPLYPSGWRARLGGFSNLMAVADKSDTDLWAVGSHIAHSDGRIWSATDPWPDAATFTGIDVVGGQAWAVTADGELLELTGGEWTRRQKVASALKAVSLTAEGGGWAVGSDNDHRGTVFHLQVGESWRPEAVEPGLVPLTGVVGITADQAWAVGQSGLILRRDHGAWQRIASPVGDDLWSVAAVAQNDVWAVGGRDDRMPNGTSSPNATQVILHFDGQRWSSAHQANGPALYAVAASTSGAWAVGQDGVLLSWDGTAWSDRGRVPLSEGASLRGITRIDGSERYVAVSDSGTIIDLDANGWSVAQSERWLTGIAMVSPTEGWAVGPGGPALHYVDGGWVPVSDRVAATELRDVDVDKDGQAWGVTSSGRMMTFADGAWHYSGSGATTSLPMNRIRLMPNGHGWILASRPGSGDGQPIVSEVLFIAQADAETVLRQFGVELRDVDGGSDTDAWAVGRRVVYHFDGNTWTPTTMDADLYAVDMISATSGWAAGAAGFYRYDGHEWRLTQAMDLAPCPITRLEMDSDGTGWAVGWQGVVLHYDGSNWRFVRRPKDLYGSGNVPFALFDFALVASDNSKTLWTVGGPAAVLSWNVPPFGPGFRIFLPSTSNGG